MTGQTKEYWSAADLKERWGLSRAQVYKHMEGMPRVRMGCNAVRVRWKDVKKFEREQFASLAPSSTADSRTPSISCGAKRAEVAALQRAQQAR